MYILMVFSEDEGDINWDLFFPKEGLIFICWVQLLHIEVQNFFGF